MTTKLTYEEYTAKIRELYNAKRVTIAERDVLRKRYPKFAAKFELLESGEILKEGSTVFVITRKHSRTGYSRSISLFTFRVRIDAGYHASIDNPRIQPLTLTFNVARLLGYSVHEYMGSDVIRTDDYPQEFVAGLSQALFGVNKSSALNCEVL